MAKRKGSKSQTQTKRIRSTVNRLKILTPAEEQFCHYVVLTGNRYNAALRAGFHPGSGWKMYNYPRIQKRIEVLRKIALEQSAKDAHANFALEVADLDMATAFIATIQLPDGDRGFIDPLHAIELGYRRLKLIGDPGVHVSAGAQATAASTGQAVNLSLEQSYRPLWLLKTEARLGKKFEQEALNGIVIDSPPSK